MNTRSLPKPAGGFCLHKGLEENKYAHPTPFRPPRGRAGLSLLEVILALAILAGALAVLGELARRSLHHAETARAASEAQLLCESKLAEIVAGITPAEAVSDAPLQTALDAEIETNDNWRYGVEVQSTDLDGLLAVRVTVTQDRPARQHPVSVSLTRWIVDPEVEP